MILTKTFGQHAERVVVVVGPEGTTGEIAELALRAHIKGTAREGLDWEAVAFDWKATDRPYAFFSSSAMDLASVTVIELAR